MEVVWLVDFDLPAVGVGVEGLGLGCAEGGEDEQLAVVQTWRREVDEAAPDRTPPRQQVGLAGFERAQERVDPHDPVPVVGDERVAFDALMKGNPSRLQPPEPGLAHELAVGQQHGVRPTPKTARKRSIKATRSAVLELPALPKMLQNTGSAIPR